jgi:hypothetical protein
LSNFIKVKTLGDDFANWGDGEQYINLDNVLNIYEEKHNTGIMSFRMIDKGNIKMQKENLPFDFEFVNDYANFIDYKGLREEFEEFKRVKDKLEKL